MALPRQILSIDFTRGLDKKADPKLIIPGKLTTLDNATFDAANSLAKARLFSSLSSTIITGAGSAPTAPGLSVATHKSELLFEASNSLFSLTPGTGATGQAQGSVQKAKNVQRTSVSVSDLARKETNQIEFDSAYATGSKKMSVWVWVESPDIHYTVIDESTGAAYFQATRFQANAGQPHVVWDAGSSLFRVFYVNTAGDICTRAINPTAPATVGAETVIFAASGTAAGAGAQLDAVYDSNFALTWVAYRLAGGGFRLLKTVDGTIGTTTSKDWAVAADTPDRGIAVMNYGGRTRVGVGICSSVNGARVFAINIALGVGDPFGNATLTASVNVQRIAFAQNLAVDKLRVVWEDGGATLDTTRKVTAEDIDNVPAVVANTSAVYRGVGLVSKPWQIGSTATTGFYTLVSYYSAFQSTVFAVDISVDLNGHSVANNGVVARVLSQEAGAYSGVWGTRPQLARPMNGLEGSNIVTVGVLRRGALRLVNGADVTPSGLARLTVRFSHSARPLQRLEFADGTIFGGGNPCVYDGQFFFEGGFHTYPDNVAATLTDAAVGTLSAGQYQVCFTYEAYDTQGRRWQSAPSIAKTITLAAGRQLSYSIPTDRLTRRSVLSGVYGSSHRVVAWRTEANGQVFYRVGDAANSIAADSVTIADNTSDANLVSNEVLYTFGGALENDSWPSCRVMCVHQDRLCMAGLVNPYEVRLTEELRPGIAPSLNTAVYAITVPPDKGEITGLASMDDKLIIGCERGIWFIYGAGWDRLGTGSSYSLPQKAVEDMGVMMASPSSLLATPDGLWFRASQGLRFLTRGLTVARDQSGMFFGAEVDSLIDGCVAAVLEPGKQLARFYTGSVVLVYDYQWGQWSRLSWNGVASAPAADAVLWNGGIAHIDTSAHLYTLDTADTNQATTIIETGWLHPAQVQGYLRVRKFILSGTLNGFGTGNELRLTLDVAYDYGAYTETAGLALNAGYVAANGDFQIEHCLSRQKCEAVRFRITYDPSTDAPGEFSTCNFTGFALEVAGKGGLFRLPSSQRF